MLYCNACSKIIDESTKTISINLLNVGSSSTAVTRYALFNKYFKPFTLINPFQPSNERLIIDVAAG